MSLGPFAASRAFTLGVELELQIVNRTTTTSLPARPTCCA